MNSIDNKQPTGSLRISRDVIATIAGTATREIEGVADLAAFTTNIKGWLIKKQTAKSIVIELNDEVATIDIHVLLCQGAKIPDVSSKIQTAVKEAVQSMTGIAVSRVNIYVSGIQFAEQETSVLPAL
ncbi:MAG: Asp23/Gls24 family envelope stress response protein [Oscillospiraceae bacterium]